MVQAVLPILTDRALMAETTEKPDVIVTLGRFYSLAPIFLTSLFVSLLSLSMPNVGSRFEVSDRLQSNKVFNGPDPGEASLKWKQIILMKSMRSQSAALQETCQLLSTWPLSTDVCLAAPFPLTFDLHGSSGCLISTCILRRRNPFQPHFRSTGFWHRVGTEMAGGSL